MHLNTEAALDLAARRLNKDQETFWRQHMETCNACATDVRQWQQLTMDLKRAHLMGASERDLANAIHIFSPVRSEGRSGIRSLVASIVFDSFMQPALAGLRGPAVQRARQVVM